MLTISSSLSYYLSLSSFSSIQITFFAPRLLTIQSLFICLDMLIRFKLFLDPMSSQHSNTDSESQVQYEEDEVLWAKIRGYPWWPAFVQKININPKSEEVEYTVFFFGDNTHAKLGLSKLRKFIEFYTDFYPRAKVNRKLMLSIQMAQEKLRQNDQEVNIFQDLRGKMKGKKPKQAQLPRMTSHQDHMSPQQQLPLLFKSRTISNSKNIKKENKEDPVSSQSDERSEKLRQSERGLPQISKKKKNKAIKEQIFQEDEQQMMVQQQMRKIQLKNSDVMAIERDGEEMSVEDNSDDVDYIHHQKRKKLINQSINGPRKRGRPRKYPLAVEEHPRSNLREHIPHKKNKIIRKQFLSEQSSPSKSMPSTNIHKKMLQKIQKLLDSREQLISYLETIKITTQNAKDILDLDVSNVLQSGNIDSRVKNILNTLKSSLLMKYFPDDAKITKNYQKISKKKANSIEIRREKSRELSENEEEMEIRKKTMVKLEKFLRTYPQIESSAKEKAIKIESQFLKVDKQVGAKYKATAYRVLSTLKEKQLPLTQILSKINQGQFDT